VSRYHDGTKHHFERLARSLGYLDWASQPRPFRSYADTTYWPLYPAPDADRAGYEPRRVSLEEAYRVGRQPADLSTPAIGDLLRHALGLSAWKRFNASRWSLRVNPSSGNLHPTEAYVIAPALRGLADKPASYHYVPERHGLELRGLFDDDCWAGAFGSQQDVVLVALTSIHWREAWKYGERAFRYCQHDLGHACAAVSLAAGLLGWHCRLLPVWSHRHIAAVTGVDRDQDFIDAEREEPGCMIALGSAPVECTPEAVSALVGAASRARWSGRAGQLSEDHVTWSFIDAVAQATEDPGRPTQTGVPASGEVVDQPQSSQQIDARALVLQRRSAVAFDGRSTLDRPAFLTMLSRVLPRATAPWAMP
jgi:SagB-type dehydrogenase family enzyme